MSRAAVFFDRDGTLMEEVHYCADPAQVRVYPGIPEALRKLNDAGILTFVITNQSGIGRGLMTLEQYQAVQEEFLRQLAPGRIDASYFCPDAPSMLSTRRKPEPGMVLEAAAEFDVDPANSWFIGDKSGDIECGRRAGTRTILVLTGYGREQQFAPDFTPDRAIEHLAASPAGGQPLHSQPAPGEPLQPHSRLDRPPQPQLPLGGPPKAQPPPSDLQPRFCRPNFIRNSAVSAIEFLLNMY